MKVASIQWVSTLRDAAKNTSLSFSLSHKFGLTTIRLADYRERKCAENYNKWHNKSTFKTAVSISLISNHNSFRVLFDKIDSGYFVWKLY